VIELKLKLIGWAFSGVVFAVAPSVAFYAGLAPDPTDILTSDRSGVALVIFSVVVLLKISVEVVQKIYLMRAGVGKTVGLNPPGSIELGILAQAVTRATSAIEEERTDRADIRQQITKFLTKVERGFEALPRIEELAKKGTDEVHQILVMHDVKDPDHTGAYLWWGAGLRDKLRELPKLVADKVVKALRDDSSH
jgi:hypothetical protein